MGLQAELQQLANVGGQLGDGCELGAGGQGGVRGKQPGRRQLDHRRPVAPGSRAIQPRHHPATGQFLHQPGGLLDRQPPGHQQKTAHPIKGHIELLGEGAGQHHGEPGAGESPRPDRHRQTVQLGPLIRRQQLLDTGQQLVGEAAAERKGAQLGWPCHPGPGHANPQHIAGAVQGKHGAHQAPLMALSWRPHGGRAAPGQRRNQRPPSR